MQQKRSSTTYKRKELLFEAQNTSETYVFLASPPQAPKNFEVLPPHISGPRGGNFLCPPIFRNPGGEVKKPLPPHLGGQKTIPDLTHNLTYPIT